MNKFPEIVVSKTDEFAWEGYQNIVQQLEEKVNFLEKKKVVLTIDCYPGVNIKELVDNLISPLQPTKAFDVDDIHYSSEKITEILQYNLTPDRVFGIFSAHKLNDFMDQEQLEKARQAID